MIDFALHLFFFLNYVSLLIQFDFKYILLMKNFGNMGWNKIYTSGGQGGMYVDKILNKNYIMIPYKYYKYINIRIYMHYLYPYFYVSLVLE